MTDPRVTALAKDISQLGYQHIMTGGTDCFITDGKDDITNYSEMIRRAAKHIFYRRSTTFDLRHRTEAILFLALASFATLFSDKVVFYMSAGRQREDGYTYMFPWFFKDTDLTLYEMFYQEWSRDFPIDRHKGIIDLGLLVKTLFPEVIND